MALRGLNDTYTLNNGVKIPVVGFGTWQTPDGEVAEKSVLAALNSGYRHIDTAAAMVTKKVLAAQLRKVALDVMNFLLLLSFGILIMAMKILKKQLILA